jgi:hypothetical protein
LLGVGRSGRLAVASEDRLVTVARLDVLARIV